MENQTLKQIQEAYNNQIDVYREIRSVAYSRQDGHEKIKQKILGFSKDKINKAYKFAEEIVNDVGGTIDFGISEGVSVKELDSLALCFLIG